MEIVQIKQGPVTVLQLRGPLVKKGMDPLERQISVCADNGDLRIVLDISQVPFIDSAGLECIQSVVSEVGKHGGDVRLCSLNDVCRDIFTATRMDGFVQVLKDRETAVRSLL